MSFISCWEATLHDRSALLQRARTGICARIGNITRESSIYESEPWGFQADHLFLNQVVRIETAFNPFQLLKEILKIELTWEETGMFMATVNFQAYRYRYSFLQR